MEHTPIPWRHNHITQGWIQDETGVLVAGVQCEHLHSAAKGISAKQMVANAELIVLAVNSHDALVAACEGLVELADDGSASFDDPEPGGVYDRARAALALAKGE